MHEEGPVIGKHSAPEQPGHQTAANCAEETVDRQAPGCLAFKSNGESHGASSGGNHEGEVDCVTHHEEPNNRVDTGVNGSLGKDGGYHACSTGIRGNITHNTTEGREESCTRIGIQPPESIYNLSEQAGRSSHVDEERDGHGRRPNHECLDRQDLDGIEAEKAFMWLIGEGLDRSTLVGCGQNTEDDGDASEDEGRIDVYGSRQEWAPQRHEEG